MTLTEELTKELWDRGFPPRIDSNGNEFRGHEPRLSELIEACGPASTIPDFVLRCLNESEWSAGFAYFSEGFEWREYVEGASPEIAVAHLWLNLRKEGKV